MTDGLAEAAVVAGINWPSRHARQTLQRWSGAQISAEEIRRLTNEQGQQHAQQQQQAAKQTLTPPMSAEVEASSATLIGLDGGWVGSREQRGGMEGKVGVIAQDKRALPTATRPDPSTLTWYELAKRARQGYQLEPPHSRARWRKRLSVATFDSSEHVGRLAAHASARLGADPAELIVVADGANWIKRETQRHFAGAPCILDWPHLWRVVRKAIIETTRDGQHSAHWRRKQSQQVKTWLWHGQAQKAVSQVQHWQETLPEGKAVKALSPVLSYLQHQRDWIGSYEQWKQQGYSPHFGAEPN